LSAVFSADQSRVLTASADGSARIWDAQSGKELVTLKGHGARVWSAVFSADQSRVLTAGDDGTARIWDVERGSLLRILVPVEDGSLTLDSEGRYFGDRRGMEFLSYYDPQERGLLRTLWKAEDLPWMQARRSPRGAG
jgi:WD40 repeat protein